MPDSGEGAASPPQVLIVDDDLSITMLIEKVLASHRIRGTIATTVAEGHAALRENQDFSVILSDHLLPDGTGVEFLRDIRETYPYAVRVIMTGLYDKSLALQAINSGEIYRFLVKPFTVEDLLSTVNQSIDRFNLQMENVYLQQQLAAQNEMLKQANVNLTGKLTEEEDKSRGLEEQTSSWKQASQGMIDLSLELIQRTDPFLSKHSHRVATVATAMAQAMNYGSDFIEKLDIAGHLHDIGLLGCKQLLRAQQRNLSLITDTGEREQIKQHPALSADLVKFLPLPEVIEAIQQHHEYLDHSGYPDGLGESRISTMAQILAVADAYDELHKDALQSLQAIQAASGQLFSPEAVHALERAVQTGTHVPREKQVLLNELLPGMKLATSIYTATGMLIVKQGQILTMPIIQRLQQHSESHAITQNIIVEV